MSTTEQKALELADRLTDNAEIDAAEGGNPAVVKLELDAAAELRRLSAENEALLARLASNSDAMDLATVELAKLRAQADADNLRHLNHTRMIKGYQDELAGLRAQVEALTVELDEVKHEPWPEWAETMLNLIRKCSGYDGFDDSDGVDLPEELRELLSEWDSTDAENKSLKAQMGALTAERTVTHRKVAEAAEAMIWAMANCDLAGCSYFFERKLEGLRAVLANATTPAPLTRPAVPEGWKLVPIDSTAPMQWAFERAETTYKDGIGRRQEMGPTQAFEARYRAMLAAAPQPEAQPTDPHANCPAPVDEIEAAEREHMGCAHCKTGIYAKAQPTEAAQPYEPKDTPQAFREAEMKGKP